MSKIINFEKVMEKVPYDMRRKLEPAQIFHEVLEHRWFMSERAGSSVKFEDSVNDYIQNVLSKKPDEQSVLGARIGNANDTTQELLLHLPHEDEY